jgi:hypothetical protein
MKPTMDAMSVGLLVSAASHRSRTDPAVDCTRSLRDSMVSSSWQRRISMNPVEVRCHYFVCPQIPFFATLVKSFVAIQ